MTTLDNLYTMSQAAKVLGINPKSTFRALVYKGVKVTKIRGLWVADKQQVDTLVAQKGR